VHSLQGRWPYPGAPEGGVTLPGVGLHDAAGGAGDHRLAGLEASATRRSRALAADKALVKLDDAAPQELTLATSHRLGDLATEERIVPAVRELC